MSLYVVKNDDGNTMDYNGYFNCPISQTELFDEPNEPAKFAEELGGHVVELVEEPKKVVLTKEQAEIVDFARDFYLPATYIHDSREGDEELLMKAYVNGYTVAKEKKYYVKVPLVQAQGGLWFYINGEDKLDTTYLQELAKKFTMDEIEENGLQDCEKEEATDYEV